MKHLVAVLGIAMLAATGEAATPTFNKDIAPILYKNCAICHRSGEVAPFSLLTYQDAAKRAKLSRRSLRSATCPRGRRNTDMATSRMSGV